MKRSLFFLYLKIIGFVFFTARSLSTEYIYRDDRTTRRKKCRTTSPPLVRSRPSSTTRRRPPWRRRRRRHLLPILMSSKEDPSWKRWFDRIWNPTTSASSSPAGRASPWTCFDNSPRQGRGWPCCKDTKTTGKRYDDDNRTFGLVLSPHTLRKRWDILYLFQ